MNIWFTSDTHFHHKAMALKYRDGFAGDVDHMNHVLIEHWNGPVRPNDTVYHLGDFSFGKPQQILEVLGRLRGRITLIKGNHDHTSRWPAWLKNQFTEIVPMKHIKIGSMPTTLCHFPMRIWDRSHYGAFHLHGHCHGNLPAHGRALDVGVDTKPYLLYHIDEIQEILSARDIHYHEDHHNLKA